MITVEKIYNYINDIAPFDTQLSWDNSGLLIGDFSNTVKHVLSGNLESVILNISVMVGHSPSKNFPLYGASS